VEEDEEGAVSVESVFQEVRSLQMSQQQLMKFIKELSSAQKVQAQENQTLLKTVGALGDQLKSLAATMAQVKEQVTVPDHVSVTSRLESTAVPFELPEVYLDSTGFGE